MRARGLIGLALLTLAVVLLAVWASQAYRARTAVEDRAHLLFPDLPQRFDAARRIEVETAAGSITIEQADGQWRVREKYDWPADRTRVAGVLTGLADLRALQPRTANPDRHARLHLDAPSEPGSKALALRLLAAEDEVLAAILIGERRGVAGDLPQFYVRRPGQAQTWLAEGPLEPARRASLWLDDDLIDIPAERVCALQVRHAAGEMVHISRPQGDAEPALVNLSEAEAEAEAEAGAGAARVADPVRVRAALYGLQRLQLQDVVRPGELAVDWAAAVEARFETCDGLAVTVRSLPHQAARYLRLEADAAAGSARQAEAADLTARLDGLAFRVAPHPVSTFTGDLAHYLVREAGAEGDGGGVER